jgi:hypothetical protein
MENQETPENKSKKTFGILAFEAGLEFAFLIAVPLIAGVLLGKWLDAKYHKHLFVILAVPFGLIISSFSVYKRINELKKMLK